MVRNEEIDTEMQLEEETPMSHAQRRKLKKRKRDDPDGDASEGEEFPAKPKSKKGKNEEGDDKTSASKNVPARLHSVWVGNLAFKTTPDDLRGFFKDVEGEITRVKMPRKEGGEKGPNKGFAYVDFATTEAKEAAIAQSERPLHGRKLLIKDDSNWQGSHSVATLADPTTKKAFIMTKTSKSILAKQKQPPCPVLFVGNLSFETTIDSLREHLESNIVKRVKKDKGKKVKKRKDEEEDDSGSDEEEGGKRKGGKEEEILTFEPQPAKPDSDSDSDSDSSSENNEPKPSNVKQEEPTKPSKAADPKELLGLRAIRLGTFEDSGSCKG
ncbi:hypothetical protein FRB90_008414 [Tulasnella sp. 427]|nr:hypothetical protein FRB90_008414 [Tulasnella sp. 427]